MLIANGIYGSSLKSDYEFNQFRQSLQVFGSNYEQLKTVEYYLFVELYASIFSQANILESTDVQIRMP